MCTVFGACVYVLVKQTAFISPAGIAAISLMALIFLCICPVSGLLGFHILLIVKGIQFKDKTPRNEYLSISHFNQVEPRPST
jgi:hypothetical protein